MSAARLENLGPGPSVTVERSGVPGVADKGGEGLSTVPCVEGCPGLIPRLLSRAGIKPCRRLSVATAAHGAIPPRAQLEDSALTIRHTKTAETPPALAERTQGRHLR